MNKIKLFYREFSPEKPQTMIILHGLFGMSDNWVSIAKHFSNRFHVIIPDLRNHGNSPHTDEFGYPEMSEDILNIMEEKKIHSATIIGHSMGGKLAMNLACFFPQIIDKLIVVDINLSESESREIHSVIFEIIANTDLKKFKTFSEIQRYLENKIDQSRIVLFVMKNIKRHENEGFIWKLNYLALFNNLHKIMEELKPMHNFIKPALFIKGGESDYISNADFIEIKKYFPLASLETIAGASHWVHADKPKEFQNVIDKFLEE